MFLIAGNLAFCFCDGKALYVSENLEKNDKKPVEESWSCHGFKSFSIFEQSHSCCCISFVYQGSRKCSHIFLNFSSKICFLKIQQQKKKQRTFDI